jgi:hypothetical protein
MLHCDPRHPLPIPGTPLSILRSWLGARKAAMTQSDVRTFGHLDGLACQEAGHAACQARCVVRVWFVASVQLRGEGRKRGRGWLSYQLGWCRAMQSQEQRPQQPEATKKQMPCYPCSRLPAPGIEGSIRPPDGAQGRPRRKMGSLGSGTQNGQSTLNGWSQRLAAKGEGSVLAKSAGRREPELREPP